MFASKNCTGHYHSYFSELIYSSWEGIMQKTSVLGAFLMAVVGIAWPTDDGSAAQSRGNEEDLQGSQIDLKRFQLSDLKRKPRDIERPVCPDPANCGPVGGKPTGLSKVLGQTLVSNK